MAKKESSQKFIARNRAPRVQIEYDLELYGAEKVINLPFVAGVMADLSGKPIVWWQLPVGNASLDNTPQHYRDNLVDWFFAHTAEVAAGGALAMLFGGGQADSTTAETDGGNLAGHLTDYRNSGGVPLCGP